MEIFGIPTDQYIIAIISFIIISVIGVVFQKVVLKFLEKMAKKTESILDDIVLNAVNSVKNWFYYVIALYLSVLFFVDLPPDSVASDTFNVIVSIVLTYQIIVVITSTIDYFVDEV